MVNIENAAKIHKNGILNTETLHIFFLSKFVGMVSSII